MAADTARYSLPYQQDSDAPDGPALGQDLAEATEAALGGVDDRVADIEVIDARSQGAKKYGNRASNKSCTTSTTGILRLDNISFVTGEAYRLVCTGIRGDTDTSTGRYKCEMRLSTAGAATTGSTSIRRVEAGDTDSSHLEKYYIATTTTTTASILLSANCYAGAATVNILGTDEGGIDLYVEHIGTGVADSGTDI